MAVAFRSTSPAEFGLTASLTIPAPAGIQSGDLLLAIISDDSGSGKFQVPPGWSNPRFISGAPAYFSYYTAGPSEPGSYTFTDLFGENNMAGFIVAYSGPAQVDVITQTAATSATSKAAASVTTTQASELVIAFWFNYQTAAVNGITLPGGLTSRGSIGADNSTGPFCAINCGEYTGPGTPGSSAPGTATSTVTGIWGSFTVALLFASAPPFAPTLTAPANNSYSDIDAGDNFTWNYNTGGATGGQTGYSLRRKMSGGNYSYWNAGGSAFQSTDLNNVSTSSSISFSAGVWPDGRTYNWSAATRDTGGEGPYAVDFTINAQVDPTVTVTAPTGTVTTTQLPVVTWLPSTAPGTVQNSYRVVTYSATQYGAGGFTPGHGPSYDDSGVIASSANSYTLANYLDDSTTYRSYVQIVEAPGNQASAWAYTGYTISTTSPVQPTIDAVYETDPSTGCPRIKITVQGLDTGGFVGTTSAVVLRSDGLYVRGASYTNQTPVPAVGQTVVIYDYEATPGTAYTYTAWITSGVFESPASDASSSATVPEGLGFWELDPLNPASAVNAQPIMWNLQSYEQSSAHQVLQQTTVNVVASAMQIPDMMSTFKTFSAAIYAKLYTLVRAQKTAFISDPFGFGYYFRLAPAPGGMSAGTGNKAHDTQLQPSTGSGPYRIVGVTGVGQPRPDDRAGAYTPVPPPPPSISPPLAYYKLDETSGTTASDATGGGNDGAWQGTLGSQWGAGKINGGGSFNGSDNYIQLPIGSINAISPRLSVQLWFKYTDSTEDLLIVNSNAANSAYWFIESFGGFGITAASDGGILNFGSGFNDGAWHHLIVVWDGSTITGYVDGVVGGSVAGGFTPQASIGPTIGGLNPAVSFGGAVAWNGSIDEVGIWDVALTVGEVTALYNGGAGLAYPF